LAPFHWITTSRLSAAALADAKQRAHAELGHLRLAQHLDLEAQPLQGLDPIGELVRVQNVGRLGHQVAGEGHPVGHRFQRLVRRLDGPHVGRSHAHGGDGRLLLGLLLGQVAVETVGGQARAEGRPRQQLRPGVEAQLERGGA
jgi:hypothetical protein